MTSTRQRPLGSPHGQYHAPEVEFVDIHSHFGGPAVLDGLSLTAAAGQITAIMGPSGVGKTTLMRHLLGLHPPNSGSVLVDGRSVWDMRAAELAEVRTSLGVLLGGSSVYEGGIFASSMSFDNVAYPLRVAGVHRDAVARRTWEWMEAFDIAGFAEMMPAELSAGARRRLALAKAFVAEPRLIVLDDPTAAIDLSNRAALVGTIRDAWARTGATMVVTTHSIALARELGQHVAMMRDGRILDEGPPDELLAGVDSAADLDRRFGISEHLPRPDPDSVSLVATRARRDGVAWSWLVLAATIFVGVAITVAVLSGVLDNPGFGT